MVTRRTSAAPHALALPYAAQGHITPMMQLAHILITNGIKVTFVNTEYNHQRLGRQLQSTDRICFLSFPDGLPPDHGRVQQLPELVQALKDNAPRHIDKIVEDSLQTDTPITLMLADGICCYVKPVVEKYNLPWIALWTASAAGLAAYHATPFLKSQGLIPLPEEGAARKEKGERLVGCLNAMEELRVKDLPSFMNHSDDSNKYLMEWLSEEAQVTESADDVVLNTWDDLEGAVVAQLGKTFSHNVLTVGPLSLFTHDMETKSSLWEEESSCLDWLDRQPPQSVIYVGFGSIALIPQQQLEELCWGLEMTGQPFLWAIRPDLVGGKTNNDGVGLPEEFVAKCGERACFVSWAPQKKVLNHHSVGCFLTHCGWNSTVDALCAGVPMMCWPYFAEQQTNRRLMSKVWNVGLELSDDGVDREEIRLGIQRIMDEYKSLDVAEAKLTKNAIQHRDTAMKATSEGGSSTANLRVLIEKVMATNRKA